MLLPAKRGGTIGGVPFKISHKENVSVWAITGTLIRDFMLISAKFSLKDKLKFDGTNLTINGGGTFSGTLSAVNGEFNGLLDAGGIKIGLNAVSTGVGGLSIDANNYWDENGNFKAGSTGSYIPIGTEPHFAIKGRYNRGQRVRLVVCLQGTITGLGDTLKNGC